MSWISRIALVLALALALPMTPATASQRCTLSFQAGQFDACQQQAVDIVPRLADAGDTRAGEYGYWAIKFPAPVSGQQQAQLQALGARILDYLPWYGYRIRLPGDVSPHGRIDGLLWAGPVAPEWKLAGGLSDLLGRAPAERPAAVPLSVALNAGANVQHRLAQWRAIDGVGHGFAITGARSDRIVLSVASAQLDELLALIAPRADVAAITVRKQMELLNARAGWLHQSGTPDQRPVFDQGLLGCGQVIGMLDSGMDYSHCAFEDTVLGEPPVSECADGDLCLPGTPDYDQRKTAQYYKWSAIDDELGDAACDPSTGAGHGTHVAASIAGNDWANAVDCSAGSPGANGSNLDGAAPGAHLIAQEMGEGLDYVNSLGGTLYHAATTAYADGARIHSNSWGGSCCFLGLLCLADFGLCAPAYDEFARDADDAMWEFPDLLITIAAGNNGTCCASSGAAVGSPGLAKSALTVGASGAGSAGDNAASFSSRGPIFDRRTKPDVMAQGDGIVSAASDGSAAGSSCATCTMSGTSMATPTAAGLAALVREYLVRGFWPGGTANNDDAIATPSAALVKAMLINGARDMGGSGADATVPNQVEGWGRIHLDDVLYFDGDERHLWLADAGADLETGAVDSYTLTVGDGQPLKVTLAWTDHPAAVNANPHLVNQLRLELVTPDHQVWTQKLPASGTPDPFQSTDTSGHDDRNVVHQILIAEPDAGEYQVHVRGINIAIGKPGQPYALVATGDLDAGTPPPLNVDLALAKSASQNQVAPGAAFDYTLAVTSDGDGAEQVLLADTLPAGLCVTGIDAPGWDCDLTGAVLGCAIDGPLVGTPAPVVVSVLAPDSTGILVNQAAVSALTPDPEPGNNDSAVTVTVANPHPDRIFADNFDPPPEPPACL